MFNQEWIDKATKLTDTNSWAHEVLDDLKSTGDIYLNTLRMWYKDFPGTEKQKKHLKQRIESFCNEDHRGGVNELSWWKFMQNNKFDVEPVPTAKGARPDFKVKNPTEFFIEVSTLNVSDKEKEQLERNGSIPLNHSQLLRRILLKSDNDKNKQISFAHQEGCPCCLVLFDYTTWSAFGSNFFRYLGNYPLEQGSCLQNLPKELSALIYVKRNVINGRIGLNLNHSFICYNQNAEYQLTPGTFSDFREYTHQLLEIESPCKKSWIWL